VNAITHIVHDADVVVAVVIVDGVVVVVVVVGWVFRNILYPIQSDQI
jgi:hypothetical protein